MSATKERRLKGLKLPLIPPREESPPLPLPLPLPPPLQSHSHSHSHSQSHSHSHSHSQSHSQSQIHSQSNSRPTPADSHNDEIHPEDTVKLHCLGHGSSGKVYKVQHKRTGVVYALKVIQEKHELSVRKQILREMDILRRSHSRYVVRCYGSSDRGGEISFLLEYMDAGSLANVLKAQGVIREGHLSEVARQVLKGLDYLHSNHIVHRDIKPSNLLMNRKQEVKIADFGVSAVLPSTLAPCSSFVGTCAYMSPERFDPDSHGGNYCGYAADIWSLGLTLLECATGHFPFLERGQMADWPSLMVAICYRDPPSPPAHFSPDFRDFITRCLQKDPARRPRACSLLSHPFVNPSRSSSGSPIADISPLLASLSL